MRRLFWLAMGVTIGVLVVRKLSRAAERMTPKGLAQGLVDALNNLADATGTFAAEVRVAMREREAELRAGTGLDGNLGRTEEIPPSSQGQSAP
jgi:hypothetical protein